MAGKAPRTIHFHIGPDRVFEGLFEKVFEPFSDEVNLSYVTSEDYRNHLREVVDSGFYEEIPQVLHDLCSTSKVIAISRPRLLFDGMPMNLKGGGSFYKLDTIQKGFHGYKVVFHLFLTDHLGYLLRSKPDMVSAASSQFSWLPLVKSISGQVAEGNELLLWNAEGKDFVQAFISATTGLVGHHLEKLTALVLRAEKVPAPEAEERFAKKIGLDVFTLDAAFERDIKKLGLA